MNALLPTLAAPITNTSRPRRSRRIAATAAGTPAPLFADTCGAQGESVMDCSVGHAVQTSSPPATAQPVGKAQCMRPRSCWVTAL